MLSGIVTLARTLAIVYAREPVSFWSSNACESVSLLASMSAHEKF